MTILVKITTLYEAEFCILGLSIVIDNNVFSCAVCHMQFVDAKVQIIETLRMIKYLLFCEHRMFYFC